jgi:hypothetical protein
MIEEAVRRTINDEFVGHFVRHLVKSAETFGVKKAERNGDISVPAIRAEFRRLCERESA